MSRGNGLQTLGCESATVNSLTAGDGSPRLPRRAARKARGKPGRAERYPNAVRSMVFQALKKRSKAG